MTSSINFRHCLRIALLACVLTGLLLAPVAHAAEVPGLDKAVLINAREQSVDQFLGELFGQIGVPVRVDESVIGSVNGDFRKTAREVFNDITSSFQLAVYFDGAVAHIYPSNDIVHNILYMSVSNAKTIQRSAQKLGLIDPYNSLSVADVGLVVTGASRFVEQVEGLAEAINQKSSKKVAPLDTYRTFQLRYAWADDVSLVIGGDTVVVPGVASLIRSLIEPGALGVAPFSGSLTIKSPTLDGLRGQGLKAVNVPDGQPVAKQPPAAADGGGAYGGSTENTRIVADPLSNSVIIRDSADRMQGYDELIRSLDKEPQMVEIEATIIDLDTDRLKELGINWRLQRDDDEALLGNGTLTDDLLRPNANVTPRGEGGFISLVLGSRQQFIARINALETQGAARIVSKPHVMTLSNVEALLDTTSTFFVRVEGQEEVDLFDVSVGTTLRVTPHVYERGGLNQIKLRVNIEDGSTSDQLVDRIPVIENSTITTQAIVDEGQSLLIGGLVRETTANGTTRVPILGRIPVLGGLFRSRTKSSTRTERMFLITPRVTSSKVAGKRFSAPILSGSEADIIQSAPLRMDATRQALNLLDESYPVEQMLPRGEGLRTGDAALAQPFQPINSTPGNDVPVVESARQRSLRERLLQPTAPSALDAAGTHWVRQIETTPPDGQPALVSAAELVHEPSNDGWKAVTSVPAVTVGATDTGDTASRAAKASKPSAAVTDDGWQVIGQ